jgi:phage shock protein PspC (stress-responsive transcriptional regulator)
MSEHTLNPPNVKRLERSRTDKVLAGVSGGLGRYFDLSPAVFRLGFVVLTLLGGAGVLVYIAAALVMPKEGEERSVAEDILANRRDHPARLVALGLVAVAVLSLLARADTWPTAGTAWVLVVVAAVIFLWTGRRRGLAIALLSILALVCVTAVAAVAAAFAWFDVSLGDGVGNHTYAPASVAAAGGGYHLGIGKLQLDLTRLPAGAPASIAASVGIGELRVLVPHDADVTVASHVKAGAIDALGRHEDGTDVNVVAGNGHELTVVANVGAGHVDVVRMP